jgi:glycolate oxidase FAD binding subunit
MKSIAIGGLEAIVASEGVIPQVETFALDGFIPQTSVAPGNENEVCALMEHAQGYQLRCIPWGGGTQIQTGDPPEQYDWALLTQRLNRVIDYQPTDLIVTVQAGVTLQRLQEVLSERAQYMPWNPPLPERSTIGGIVASGRSGSWRWAHGTPRDRLLAMRAVRADGTAFKSGAKVVKSVAGYDLHHLFCGSWGTLGVITEVTLKVSPLPEARITCFWQVDSCEQAEQALIGILTSPLQPETLDFLNAPASLILELANKPTLITGFSGVQEAVDWQVNYLREQGYTLSMANAERITLLRDLPATPRAVLARLSVRSGDLCQWMSYLEQRVDCGIYAHAGSGVFYAWVDEQAQADTFIEAVQTCGARYLFLQVPPEKKRSVRAWGPTPEAEFLMKRLKSEFDPRRILAPGRFF